MRKCAIITGASRGIGAAIAEEFAKQGYALSLCCSRSKEELNQLANKIREEYKTEVLEFVGDVADVAFVKQMVEETAAKFDGISVLVNNAGISYVGLLTDMEIEDWNRVVSTNLTSVFATCKYAVPYMVSAKSGKIINISSVWGVAGASCEVAYSATKGGMNAFTRALGKELAPSNVQVNAIACGMIDTAMNACFSEEDKEAITEEIPAGRMGAPEEVAKLVWDLASDHGYLTGQVITLDGGWL